MAIASLEAPGTPGADEPSDWILRDCSLLVAPGETVAVVGHSGAGKTTLANLICRLSDVAEGAVRIDGHDPTRVDQERAATLDPIGEHQVGASDRDHGCRVGASPVQSTCRCSVRPSYGMAVKPPAA